MILAPMLTGLALMAQTAPSQAAEPTALELRAERCHAHMELLIEEAVSARRPVAGPNWAIRDWWAARLPAGVSAASQASIRNSLRFEKTYDPPVFAAERSACVDEATQAGAVPRR